jgi:transcription elongation GreA/GreB family factor
MRVRRPIAKPVDRVLRRTSNTRDDERREIYRVVGEDEAEPSRGTVSYMSPLARALMGNQVGDVLRVGRSEAEILAIKPFR